MGEFFVDYFFLLKFKYFEREREKERSRGKRRERGRGRKGERDRDRKPSRLCTSSAEPHVGSDLKTSKIMT